VTVYCQKPGCDRSWPRDPALEVACPSCGAGIGQKCKRPSGHTAWQGWVHGERDIIADRQGQYGVCPSGRCGLKTEPTDQGNQYVIPGCEKDKTKGPDQMDLF